MVLSVSLVFSPLSSCDGHTPQYPIVNAATIRCVELERVNIWPRPSVRVVEAGVKYPGVVGLGYPEVGVLEYPWADASWGGVVVVFVVGSGVVECVSEDGVEYSGVEEMGDGEGEEVILAAR